MLTKLCCLRFSTEYITSREKAGSTVQRLFDHHVQQHGASIRSYKSRLYYVERNELHAFITQKYKTYVYILRTEMFY
jgi:hypothetical protein